MNPTKLNEFDLNQLGNEEIIAAQSEQKLKTPRRTTQNFDLKQDCFKYRLTREGLLNYDVMAGGGLALDNFRLINFTLF